MSKPSNTSTLSPLALGVGGEILTEDVLDVLGQLNWSFQNRPRVHISHTTGIDGWGGGDEISIMRILVPQLSAPQWAGGLRFRIHVRPEVESIAIGARFFFEPSTLDAGEAYWEIGGATLSSGTQITMSADHADNGDEIVSTVSTAITGTGSLLCLGKFASRSGSGAANFLRSFRVEDHPVATLPDPGTD